MLHKIAWYSVHVRIAKSLVLTLSMQISQAVKTGAALKRLGENSREIQGGSQEMATKFTTLNL